MTTPFLEWRGVFKAFGPKKVLVDFNLSIAAGESVAILGGSGVGKSVALRLAIGLLEADAGQILVDGRAVGGLSEAELLWVRRRVAMVFQAGALFDSMSVGENVAFGFVEHHQSASTATRDEAVLHSLELVGLDPHVLPLLPSSLSGGMRKRVALARALAVRPEAILYDEPTTGLDPVTTARVNRLIRDLQRRLEVTSVVVTHDVQSALFVADRLVYLREGRLVFDGSVEEAKDAPSPELAAFMAGEEFAAADAS